MAERKVIELEQGWDFMKKGISKLINLLEGVPEQQFNPEEYMMLYTYVLLPSLVLHGNFASASSLDPPFVVCRTIYNMCTQKPPQDYSQQLYDRYRESFEEYINEMVCVKYSLLSFMGIRIILILWAGSACNQRQA